MKAAKAFAEAQQPHVVLTPPLPEVFVVEVAVDEGLVELGADLSSRDPVAA